MSYLDGVSYYTQKTHEDYIVDNIIGIMSYGLLELGAYVNIRRGQLNIRGEDASLLRNVSRPGIANYTRYSGTANNWIWETGVQRKDANVPAPISISGIYCNNIFYPTGTTVLGTGYIVNYRESSIVFAHPVTGNIQVERSERGVNVYSSDSDIYKQLTKTYQNQYSFNVTGSGYDLLSINARDYMPAVIVHLSSFSSKPAEIGSRAKWSNGIINFEIFATNADDRKRLSTICYMLEDKAFPTFNINNKPIIYNMDGSLASTAQSHKDSSVNYNFGTLKFGHDARIMKQDKYLPLNYANVTISASTKVDV